MTDRNDYVELHASSAFSFLTAASHPEDLVEQAAALGMDRMAITDRNGVYGAARFHSAAQRHGLRAHIGAEIAIREWNDARIVLLCATQTGYQNLCQLITRFKMRETTKADGAATLDYLTTFASGLICLSGGEDGPLATALAATGAQSAEHRLAQLSEIFGRHNLYCEMQRHEQRIEEARNQALISVADHLRLPIVATNGVRAARREERAVLDVLLATRHRCTLEQAGRLLSANDWRHLRDARTMQQVFSDLPEAIANTRLISERLDFTLDRLGYEFPHYPVPSGATMDSFLAQRVDEGIRKRYGISIKRSLFEKARKQAARELALIARLGFAGYFLIVWDLIRFCQREDILVQGRGSAANSVVCYALEITAVDPVGMELLFERFLNECRNEWPDIDLDLPSGAERERVIQYVYQRYGQLGAAMTANVISYRSRSTTRDVGKALGFDDEQIARLGSIIGHWEWKGDRDTLAARFQQAGFDLKHPRLARYFALSKQINQLPRHLGQHSGGMVICAGMLNRVVPIERASMSGRTVIQWDKEDCADMGLIKVDLLGLGMMAALKDTIELVTEHYHEKVDLAALPEDPKVYETLRRADTVGMFQVESRAQMASIPLNGPTRFYDLVVQVAIVRPGPIAGKMMQPYLRRRLGRERVSYHHPLLEPVLKRTLGVPLFQEQLLRMAMVVAGFSGSEADELRRAVGMRRSMERMKNLEGRLRAGMSNNGMNAEAQDNIVQSISSFALYGFPESHAASFALIAYASAYLKVHYLGAFTCALLNNQPMGFYSPAVLVKDAQRHGLRIRPMDVQRSNILCTLEAESDGSLALRIGLNYARGLRDESRHAIMMERSLKGPYATVDDLARRVPELQRRELVLLAQIGALNQLEHVEHRRDALWQVEKAGRPTGPLLADLDECEKRSPLHAMSTDERLMADFAGVGLTTGPHPMAYAREQLRSAGILASNELTTYRQGQRVQIAGCVIARQRPGTAKGFVFLSLEDEAGIANIILDPDFFERERITATRARFLLVTGIAQNNEGVLHIKAIAIEPIDVSSAAVWSHDFH